LRKVIFEPSPKHSKVFVLYRQTHFGEHNLKMSTGKKFIKKEPGDKEIGLRKISKEELKSVLKNHSLWLNSEKVIGQPANLEGYNLRGAILLGANLRNANLKGAYLYGAYLKNANLEQANLAGANLRGANLRWVNLKEADLTGANLTRADMHQSHLEKTNLTGANLQMSDGLTKQQIDQALTNKTTRFPSGSF